MRNYIRRDLLKYVDYAKIRELERSRYSQKAERFLQSILYELTCRLSELESSSLEKDSKIDLLQQALRKQQRYIISQNEKESRLQEQWQDRRAL